MSLPSTRISTFFIFNTLYAIRLFVYNYILASKRPHTDDDLQMDEIVTLQSRANLVHLFSSLSP